MTAGILYIVATPIGNLGDITYRAVETLQKIDAVVCEDTRTSRKLLERYEIKAPTISLYGRGRGSKKPILKIEVVLNELKSGKNLAFMSDAGTPGITDPGNQLVEKAVEVGISVIPVPGVSSLTTLVSVSGIDMSRFVFLGFPPHKKGRETFFKEVSALNYPVIYFESPHRLVKNLELLKTLAPGKNIILGRELTKMFEEIVRGNVEEVLNYFLENKEKVRGEIAIIIH